MIRPDFVALATNVTISMKRGTHILKSTFAGIDLQAGTRRAPVGAAGFSLRPPRGLKPTALFSGPSAASRRPGVRNAGLARSATSQALPLPPRVQWSG